jgi:hypothetical protein
VLKPVRIEQALQGTSLGVDVTSQSGSPGAFGHSLLEV